MFVVPVRPATALRQECKVSSPASMLSYAQLDLIPAKLGAAERLSAMSIQSVRDWISLVSSFATRRPHLSNPFTRSKP